MTTLSSIVVGAPSTIEYEPSSLIESASPECGKSEFVKLGFEVATRAAQ